MRNVSIAKWQAKAMKCTQSCSKKLSKFAENLRESLLSAYRISPENQEFPAKQEKIMEMVTQELLPENLTSSLIKFDLNYNSNTTATEMQRFVNYIKGIINNKMIRSRKREGKCKVFSQFEDISPLLFVPANDNFQAKETANLIMEVFTQCLKKPKKR